MKENIKILITGASGYIGNCLFHFLRGKFKVIGIDKRDLKLLNDMYQSKKTPWLK